MSEIVRNNLDIYDDVAADWWSDDIRWIRTLKNLVPGRLRWFDKHIDWVGKRVLDVGCAGGFMTEAIAAKGGIVTGIDPAREAIAAAKSHAAQQDLAVNYDVGTGEALPYDSGSFDAVVCVDVLEHVQDVQQVIREIARVLDDGGVFLFDTINRHWIARLATITIAEDWLRLLPRGTHDPAKYIRPRELRDMLTHAGLIDGPMTGLGPRGVNRRLDLTFGPLPFKTILYMGVASKARASDD
ncbi:MAG: bifunctional 2-polyprenyl-6-hydroxyphenol methylase/3-demethylubiquinol 3-O-methyltransferase UbiG [Pseudomonadota bacterium]